MGRDDLIALTRDYLDRLERDRVTFVASELAYAFLLSLFPFLIFAVNVLAYTPASADRVLELAARYVPSPLAETIDGTVRGVLENRSGGLLSLGVLGVVWSASRAANAVIFAVNRAYDAAERRAFWRARLLALAITGLLIASVLLSLLLPVLGWVLGRLSGLLGLSTAFVAVWEVVRWVFSLLLLTAGFLVLYYLAPNTEQRLREALPGAVVAALGWQSASWGFSLYLSSFANYSAVYGSLGGVIALMIWLYLAGLVLLLGGEFNALLHARRRARGPPGPEAGLQAHPTRPARPTGPPPRARLSPGPHGRPALLAVVALAGLALLVARRSGRRRR